MANHYVRSGGDAGAWTGTVTTVASATSADSAGDVIYVASDHNESVAASQTWSFAGTLASPTKVICGTTTAMPPTATSMNGVVNSTGNNDLIIEGSAYVYGLTINKGSGGGNTQLYLGTSANSKQTFESCVFKELSTGGSSRLNLNYVSNNAVCDVHFINCNVSFATNGQSIGVGTTKFRWDGGSILSGHAATTGGLFNLLGAGRVNIIDVSGVDFSNLGSASYLVTVGTGNAYVTFRNCKLPSSWTGGLYTGTLQSSDRIEMYNCDNADTNYRLWVADYFGSIVSDTSVYNDAGADDGSAQGFSWKMVSSANAEFPHEVLVSPEIVKWNETTTGTLTATVEIVHNSQGSGTNGALLDNEIWLEVMCLDPGGTPLGKWQSDRCGNLNLNSDAADQASSSATWTGDAAGWDTQKLTVSFTPKEKGYVHAHVCLAKASATVYVDPLLTIA